MLSHLRLFVPFLCAIQFARAIHINLNRNSRICFYEYVRQKRTAYLRVGVTKSQDDLGIRLVAYGPYSYEPKEEDEKMKFFDEMIYSEKKEDSTDLQHRGFNFRSEHRGGWHKYCLDNTHSNYDDKTVEFHTEYTLSVEGETGDEDELENFQRIEHMEGVSKLLDDVRTSVELIQSEQAFYKEKEGVHFQTLESSNSRLLFYTFVEIALLALMYGLQSFLIHKWFNDRGFLIRQYA